MGELVTKEKNQVQPGLSGPLKKRIQQLVDSNPVMLFMKGTPEEPKCGFSRKVVDLFPIFPSSESGQSTYFH